jgi:hypothetical protein
MFPDYCLGCQAPCPLVAADHHLISLLQMPAVRRGLRPRCERIESGIEGDELNVDDLRAIVAVLVFRGG